MTEDGILIILGILALMLAVPAITALCVLRKHILSRHDNKCKPE